MKKSTLVCPTMTIKFSPRYQVNNVIKQPRESAKTIKLLEKGN